MRIADLFNEAKDVQLKLIMEHPKLSIEDVLKIQDGMAGKIFVIIGNFAGFADESSLIIRKLWFEDSKVVVSDFDFSDKFEKIFAKGFSPENFLHAIPELQGSTGYLLDK